MATKIFKTYSDFYNRKDKKLNGVSEDFAKNRPDWETDNETNEGCWNCSRCSGCSGCSGCSRCSDCSDCSRCSGCSDCSRCSRCSDCSRCSGCSGCSGCSRCSGCSDCSDCSGLKNAAPVEQSEENPNAGFQVPVIENIHQKVLEAVTQPDAFNMNQFHACETTHCWAGWVIHLAGQPGYELEKKTSSVFAAMQILHKSSPIPVSPTRFFETNDEAMEQIKKCAELEKQQNG